MTQGTRSLRSITRQGLLGLTAALLALTLVIGVSRVEGPTPASADDGAAAQEASNATNPLDETLPGVDTGVPASPDAIGAQLGDALSTSEELGESLDALRAHLDELLALLDDLMGGVEALPFTPIAPAAAENGTP